jgi:hypothetical protein
MKFTRRVAQVSWMFAIAGLAGSAVSTLFISTAFAADPNEDHSDAPLVTGVRFGEILNEFDDAYFSHDRTFYRNRTLPGQAKYLIGPFPENEIAKDGKDVNKLYREVLYRQMNAGPIIRTADLPTPFPFSIRTLPASSVSASPIEVTPAPAFVPSAVNPPVAPPAQGPVRGLW